MADKGALHTDPFFEGWQSWTYDDWKRKRLVIGLAQHIVFDDAQRSQSGIIWNRFALLTNRLLQINHVIHLIKLSRGKGHV